MRAVEVIGIGRGLFAMSRPRPSRPSSQRDARRRASGADAFVGVSVEALEIVAEHLHQAPGKFGLVAQVLTDSRICGSTPVPAPAGRGQRTGITGNYGGKLRNHENYGNHPRGGTECR